MLFQELKPLLLSGSSLLPTGDPMYVIFFKVILLQYTNFYFDLEATGKEKGKKSFQITDCLAFLAVCCVS